jgi:hypothetical protein
MLVVLLRMAGLRRSWMRPAPVRAGCHFLAAWPWLSVSAGRLQPRAPHPIPMMRVHLPAHDYALMDSAPARYTIRLSGHLGATVLSAFPALESQLSGAETVLTGLLDRSALYGVLAEIEALGLDILEVRRHDNDGRHTAGGAEQAR